MLYKFNVKKRTHSSVQAQHKEIEASLVFM